MFESGSPEHVVVRMELNQLLTRATGNGVLVHISITTTRTDKM